MADAAYDVQGLRDRLRRRGVDLIAPKHPTHVNNTQDGRKLRRYKHRWIVERTNGWLNTACRRLTTRWDRLLTVIAGFVHVAIIMICMRRL